MRVVVAGYVVRGPVGGAVWSPLQYVLGLQRLGHDVYFIEDSDNYPACYDPEKHVTARDPPTACGLLRAASRGSGSANAGLTTIITRVPGAGRSRTTRDVFVRPPIYSLP
jgi:hypothetical protein